MATNELVKQPFSSVKTGGLEIGPGQAKQLAFMRRFAPDFINRQLWNASKKLVSVGMGRHEGSHRRSLYKKDGVRIGEMRDSELRDDDVLVKVHAAGGKLLNSNIRML